MQSSWKTGTCKTNGIDVHYRRTGGDKPPIVLLHGLMGNGACWAPLARTLEKDYDVIMPDARGHGNTIALDHGYHYENLAADVIGLIDTLRLDKPLVLGHSMGGMTAAVVASQIPKRIQGLILAEPTFITLKRQREVYESNIVDQHRRILKRSREEFLAEMFARPNRRSREIIELLVQARFQTSIHAFGVLTPPNPDYKLLIKTLDIPILLVLGDVGSVIPAEIADELAQLNPYLEVNQIKDAGHGVPYDQPELFSAAIQSFFFHLL